jgi:hypothetical protein
LLRATCASRSATETFITSTKGFGHSPISSTAAATVASSQNSLGLRSESAATAGLATAPKITRLYIQSV